VVKDRARKAAEAESWLERTFGPISSRTFVKDGVSVGLDELLALYAEHIEDGWIPVSERLPEAEAHVLVWADGTVQAQYRPDSLKYRWDCDTYGLSADEVTHWRPLPAPPEEGK